MLIKKYLNLFINSLNYIYPILLSYNYIHYIPLEYYINTVAN